jgi:sterol 3beta-glucosyltransferase
MNISNISMVASGSRGDVQPYVGLGVGLQAAGYTVRILTSDDFKTLVEGAGLTFVASGPSIESVVQSDEWRKVTEGGNFLTILRHMNREMKGRAADLAQRLPPLLEGTELMITGVSGMGGPFAVAEKLGIPLVQAYLFPITPTSDFASPLTPTLPFGKALNAVSFQALRFMLWQTGRMGDVQTRRLLGMKGGSPFGPYRHLQQKQIPVLYGFSKHVIPPPADWDERHHITGYWFLDAASDWTPPADLVDFLNAGAPPVYIGFGSMGNRNPEEVTKLTLKALELSGQRAILASGWGGLQQTDLPPTVQMIRSVPHSWLFPQMAAVVHHGGAGTTAAGLRAGVPSIIIPFFGDQPFWGKRVAALGVGTAPIPRQKLTAERLAQAITQAVSDQAIRRRAAELGAKIESEHGAANAAAILRQLEGQLKRL